MKNIFKILFLFILFVGISFADSHIEKEIEKHLSNLPFEAPKISLPIFKDQSYNILEYGAKGDGITKNTLAIAKAINECNSKGGGHVIIPSGMWITGPIELKSNVDFHLENGAILVFSEDHKDFPLIQTSSKSYEVMTPIYGRNLENIAITGGGIFDGNGHTWRPVKKNKLTLSQWKDLTESGGIVNEKGDMWWPSKNAMDGEKYLAEKNKKDLTKDDYENVKDFLRPYMFSLERCKNIFLDSFTLQNSPKFAMNLRSCNNIIVRNLKVMNEWWFQNGDGLDLSACKNVLMYGCSVNAGDDGICLKSSGDYRDSYGMENIIIADCIVYHAHGGFVIGSNTDGGIRNVCVKNCTFTWTDTGLRFKRGIGRGGRVENIFIQGIYMKDIQAEAITFDMFYSDAGAVKMKDDKIVSAKTPHFRKIFMQNIFVDGAAKIFFADGMTDAPVENIYLKNSVFKCHNGFDLENASSISLNELTVSLNDGTAFSINNCDKILIDGVSFRNPEKISLKLSGEKTKDILINKIQPEISLDAIEFSNGTDKNVVHISKE